MAGKWVRDSLSEMVFKPNTENIKELARTRGRGKVFWVEGKVAWRAK